MTKKRRKHSRQAREAEIPHAERIVAESMLAREGLQRELVIRPIIKRLDQKADIIRERNLARTMRQFGDDVDDVIKEPVAKLSQTLVEQLRHTPIAQLRTNHDLAPLVDDLFQLEES